MRPYLKQIPLVFALFFMALQAHAESPIRKGMKEIKIVSEDVLSSPNLESFQHNVLLFERLLDSASHEAYEGTPAEQYIYLDGMDELKQGMTEVHEAVAAKDVLAAKQAFKQLLNARQRYHHALGVSD